MIPICDSDVSSTWIWVDLRCLVNGVRRQNSWRANCPAGSFDFILAFRPHSGSLDITSTVSARPVYSTARLLDWRVNRPASKSVGTHFSYHIQHLLFSYLTQPTPIPKKDLLNSPTQPIAPILRPTPYTLKQRLLYKSPTHSTTLILPNPSYHAHPTTLILPHPFYHIHPTSHALYSQKKSPP